MFEGLKGQSFIKSSDVKGQVHPKIRIQSLSTHRCADGKSGILQPTKHFRSFS